jgi:hypothetical protein
MVAMVEVAVVWYPHWRQNSYTSCAFLLNLQLYKKAKVALCCMQSTTLTDKKGWQELQSWKSSSLILRNQGPKGRAKELGKGQKGTDLPWVMQLQGSRS